MSLRGAQRRGNLDAMGLYLHEIASRSLSSGGATLTRELAMTAGTRQ
jgi:hypothetical protein